MHIEKVNLEGFLSYVNAATLGPLSPGINIIVGENGAGKSNLLYAIETMISSEISLLTRQQRLAVLSTAPGMQCNVATIQVVVNNKSRRLPQEQDCVTVTRTIGPSTTTLKIGNSMIGKKDFIDYLHCAGFSSENMFHIIRQGQVREVLRMTPQERLHLVQRFAGWEALGRLEKLSLECSDHGDTERKRVEDIVDECREKLQKGDQNMQEAKRYKALELSIRTINSVLLEREANFLRKTLEQIEDSIAETEPQHALAKQTHLRISNALQEKKLELRQLREEAQDRTARLEDIRSQLCQAEADVAKERLHENQLQAEIGETGRALQKLTDSLATSDQAVKDMTLKLANTVESLRALERKEDQLQRRVQELMNEKDAVMQRVRHGQIFDTTQERNSWVEEEVQKIESILQDIQQQCENLQLEVQASTAEKERYITEEKQAQAELDSLRQLDARMKVELLQLHKQSYAAVNKYTLAQRLEEDCHLAVSKARNDLLWIQPRMVSVMGKNEFHGWQGLRRLLASEADPAAQDYVGMLVDHLQFPDNLRTALAAALGRKLFTHLVQTSTSAGVLLHKFSSMEVQGCLGFQALNKTRIQEQYPDPDSDAGVRRLIDLVQCSNAVLAPLLPYWLGNWLLCPDLEAAQEACHVYKANCVTLEGDTVRVGGSMTGGYRDPMKNEFAVYEEFRRLFDVLHSAESSLKESSDAVHRISAESAEISSKIQMLELKIMRNTDAISRSEAKIASLRSSLLQIEDGIKAKEQALHKRLVTAENYQNQKKALLWERSSDRVDHLTESFEQRLFEGTRSLEKLNKKLKSIKEQELKTLHKKNNEDSTLKYCLLPELDRLNKERQSLEDKRAALETELELSRTRLTAICETRESLKNQITELENNTCAQPRILSLEQIVQEMSEETARSFDDLEEASKQMETLTLKKAATLAALDEVKKKASMFGAISENLDAYRNMSRAELVRERQCLQVRLNRMNPPDLLVGRLIEEASEKLDEVCRHLRDADRIRRGAGEMTDSQKGQQLEDTDFTLKQVSRYFEDLFSKFVPQGCARMVFRKERRGRGRTQEERYEGLELKASFASQGVLQAVDFFSGGQQTVVALCFILALQKCDPAPFYIFDEIDACLDTQHRQCLADVLEELSSNSQFICTTFRPELTPKGKIFKVTQRGGVSSIAETTQQEALQLLQAREVD